MSRRNIQLENRVVIISPDDPVPLAGRIQAVFKLRITDELTKRPPESTITLKVEERGYITRVASDGLAGLVAIPQEVTPRLNAQNYPIHLTIRAPGYVDRELLEEIPQDLNFPLHFAARHVDLGLHREPVTISGRTVRIEGTPLPGSDVTVTALWRLAPNDVSVPPDPQQLVHLRPPLYVDRPAATQKVQPRDLAVVAGSDKTLLNDVSPGVDAIRLSNRQGLAAGAVLHIDADQPDLSEFIEIESVPTTSAPDQPTLISLNQRLTQSHRRDAVVRLTQPQPPGPQRPFAVDATAGDMCIFLNNLAGLGSGQLVQFIGLAGKDEFHEIRTYSVLSDANGYYRLPPLSRVAQIAIHAEKTVGPQTFERTTIFRPDYRLRENHLDLTLAVP
jgi:hypothetical protein